MFGATEIAGVDKSARSKLQGVENAGVDNAGVENAVPSMKGESTVKIKVFFRLLNVSILACFIVIVD